MYGLGDAPRSFFLRLRKELLNLGTVQSQLDQGLYYYYDHRKQLIGILTVHVDDILHGGNDTFYQKVIQPLSLVLKFGTTNTNRGASGKCQDTMPDN